MWVHCCFSVWWQCTRLAWLNWKYVSQNFPPCIGQLALVTKDILWKICKREAKRQACFLTLWGSVPSTRHRGSSHTVSLICWLTLYVWDSMWTCSSFSSCQISPSSISEYLPCMYSFLVKGACFSYSHPWRQGWVGERQMRVSVCHCRFLSSPQVPVCSCRFHLSLSVPAYPYRFQFVLALLIQFPSWLLVWLTYSDFRLKIRCSGI